MTPEGAERAEFDANHNVRTDGQIHLGAINLNDMTESDLRIASEHPALHLDVREYASIKASARAQRLSGNIALATRREQLCDRIYSRMPRSCRW